MNQRTVIHFGLVSDAKKTVESLLKDISIQELPYDLEKFLEMDESDPHPKLVIAGAPPEGVSTIEVAQTIRGQFTNSQILMVTDRPLEYSKKDLIKNGFDEVYYFPTDTETFESDLKSFRDMLGQFGLHLVSVKALDLMDIENLGFPTYIYLPANHRYVPFSAADDFTNSKKTKLQKYAVTNIHIEQKNLPLFYEAFAKAIKRTQTSDKISETEKQSILKEAVRDLISELFTSTTAGMGTGMRINKSCKDIVQSYLMTAQDTQSWFNKMSTLTNGPEDFYSRSTNSMVAATLIALGLGLDIKNIDALAVAALLHQIGFARLPIQLKDKNKEDMTPKEFEQYSNHPKIALEILKEKKIVLPELAYKIIIQQEERFDGCGFPSGLKGSQICPEAQILQLTTSLMKRMDEKKKFTNFKDVFNDFRHDLNANPSNRPVDQALFEKIADLFKRSTDSSLSLPYT